MTQHKGIQNSRPLGKTSISNAFDSVNQKADAPDDHSLNLSYGEIAEVDNKTNKIRVNIVNPDGTLSRMGAGGPGMKDGIWIPVIYLQSVHTMFGSLREKLIVRVFWRGRDTPKGEIIAEVISDDTMTEFLSGSRQPRSNELNTGAHDIFTGGVNA